MRASIRLLFVLSIALCGIAGCDDAEEGTDLAAADEGGGATPADGGGGATPDDGGGDEAAKPARRFLEVAGTVTIDGNAAEVGGEISATAKIKTGGDGHAVVTLEPGGVIEIRKDTELTLGKSERKDISLRLLAGAVWNFLPNSSSFEVETNNATAGVRGTVFYVEASGDKKSYICACDGAVSIAGKAKKSFKQEPKSQMGHKAFYVTTKGKKDKAKKAKRERHTEDQKMALMPFMEQAK